MKVILCEDVSHIGEMGATVTVADGYARNFLIPRKLAVQADSASAKQIEHELRIIGRREEKKREALTKVAKELEALTIEIKARAGEEDRIFGSVTNANIAEKLKEMGRDIDRKMIHIDEPIKALGIYSVAVRLKSGIEASVKVWVTKEETEEEAAAKAEAEAAEKEAE